MLVLDRVIRFLHFSSWLIPLELKVDSRLKPVLAPDGPDFIIGGNVIWRIIKRSNPQFRFFPRKTDQPRPARGTIASAVIGRITTTANEAIMGPDSEGYKRRSTLLFTIRAVAQTSPRWFTPHLIAYSSAQAATFPNSLHLVMLSVD